MEIEDLYAVKCPEHGHQLLTPEQYDAGLDEPEDTWKCPVCGAVSSWDGSDWEPRLNALMDANERFLELVLEDISKQNKSN